MANVHKYAIVIGFAGCLVSIASFAGIDRSKSRVEFDNNGYPPSIGVHLWLDDALVEGRSMRATCTTKSCETEPLLIPKGRHQLRVRVLIDDKMSPFTVTTIER